MLIIKAFNCSFPFYAVTMLVIIKNILPLEGDADSKMMAVPCQVIPFFHINSCFIIDHNL